MADPAAPKPDDPCPLKTRYFELPNWLALWRQDAQLDVLPTGVNRRQWGRPVTDRCVLCGMKETTAHVLNICTFSMSKFHWRHNSVLRHLVDFIHAHSLPNVKVWSDLRASDCSARPMHGAVPMHLLPDNPADQRPDIMVAIPECRILLLIELTCPLEQNVTDAVERKLLRYKAIVERQQYDGWRVEYKTIEVTSRGYVPNGCISTALQTAANLELMEPTSQSQLRQLCKDCCKTVLACSKWIWESQRSGKKLRDNYPLHRA